MSSLAHDSQFPFPSKTCQPSLLLPRTFKRAGLGPVLFLPLGFGFAVNGPALGMYKMERCGTSSQTLLGTPFLTVAPRLIGFPCASLPQITIAPRRAAKIFFDRPQPVANASRSFAYGENATLPRVGRPVVIDDDKDRNGVILDFRSPALILRRV